MNLGDGNVPMTYELLYIIPTRYTDAEIEGIQIKVRGFIEKFGGQVIKEENLGRIRLAYPIKQNRHGSYILTYFTAEPIMLVDLENLLRLNDEVIRHMIVQLPKGVPDQQFTVESYVAPLSEEDEEEKKPRRASLPEATKAEVVPSTTSETEPIVKEEKPLSIEELDKKLDEILSADLNEKV